MSLSELEVEFEVEFDVEFELELQFEIKFELEFFAQQNGSEIEPTSWNRHPTSIQNGATLIHNDV